MFFWDERHAEMCKFVHLEDIWVCLFDHVAFFEFAAVRLIDQRHLRSSESTSAAKWLHCREIFLFFIFFIAVESDLNDDFTLSSGRYLAVQ